MRLLLAIVIIIAGVVLRADVIISPDGSDSNPGTIDQPVQTLEQARAILRMQGGGTAWLRGGEYYRTTSFVLGPPDSSTIWRSWPGEEAYLIGGKKIGSFEPSSAGPGIYQTSLPAQGIRDYGKLSARGFGRDYHVSALELFFEGQPMPLSGWPDVGWAYTSGTPSGAQGGMFSVSTTHLARWQSEPDLWVHGYWTFDWADSHERVVSVDVARGTIRTAPPHGVYGYAAQRRFRVENVLSELDTPGEWYLDRSSGILYFYPPKPVLDGEVVVSMLEGPLVSISSARNVQLFDLTLEYSRGNGIEISDGANVTVSWCTFRGLGIMAVSVQGGSNHTVEYSSIRDTGEGGILLKGGDRLKLIPSGHVAWQNQITRYNRWVRTYRPAITMSGIGQKALQNRIHHAPHQAIALDGNDHLIEGNDIHSVVWETSDAGAFYMGHDLTWRGNVLRSNSFRNLGTADVFGIYLDDCASGTLVEGNLLHRAGRSVYIGGGRDNIIYNNLIIGGSPAIGVDARGLTWAQSWFTGKEPVLLNALNALPYQSPPWSSRYPALVKILSDEPAVPKGNIISNNASTLGSWLQLSDNTRRWVQAIDNITAGNFGFIDATANDFRLRDDSPLFRQGFQPLRVPDPGDSGDVLNYRVETVLGQANQVRLVVENLGRSPASGTVQFWTWPGDVRVSPGSVGFKLGPGETLDQRLPVLNVPPSGHVYAGVRLSGDDLTPLPVALR